MRVDICCVACTLLTFNIIFVWINKGFDCCELIPKAFYIWKRGFTVMQCKWEGSYAWLPLCAWVYTSSCQIQGLCLELCVAKITKIQQPCVMPLVSNLMLHACCPSVMDSYLQAGPSLNPLRSRWCAHLGRDYIPWILPLSLWILFKNSSNWFSQLFLCAVLSSLKSHTLWIRLSYVRLDMFQSALFLKSSRLLTVVI